MHSLYLEIEFLEKMQKKSKKCFDKVGFVLFIVIVARGLTLRLLLRKRDSIAPK